MPTNRKPFKTFTEQAELLLNRGLIADKNDLIRKLESVNYYRLSGYSFPFRKTPLKNEEYRQGTSLKIVWEYYLLDRRLRLLIIDAIERIEIALRTRIAYYWAQFSGISNPQSNGVMYNATAKKERLIENVQASYDRSEEDFVAHHRAIGVTDVEQLPVWVFIELSTFGDVVSLFNGMPRQVQEDIIQSFGLEKKENEIKYFKSLLSLIRVARNCCAHHARIWNKRWVHTDATGKKRPIVKDSSAAEWKYSLDRINQWAHNPSNNRFSFDKSQTGFLLTVCRKFLKHISDTSKWRDRVFELMDRSETPRNACREMGLCENWRDHPIWQ